MHMRAHIHAHVVVAASNALGERDDRGTHRHDLAAPTRCISLACNSELSFRRCDVAVFGLGDEFARFQKCTVVIASILHVIPFA